LIVLAVPALSFPFLILAVGQGPEVWAATAIVAGLILLVEALRRRSARWALAAGTVAGLSEWFRTGNLLLFAVPCAVYSLSALRLQTRRQGDQETRGPRAASPCLLVSLSSCLIPALALVAWVAVAAAADLAVPSPVNKTVANLWDCRTDMEGPAVVEEHPDGTHLVISMLGYSLVPVQGTNLQTGPVKSATYFDYAVRSSRGRSTLDFLRGNAGVMARAYIQHLQQVLTSGLRGLRQAIGNLIVLLFGVQLLCSVGNGVKPSDPFSKNAASHTFAVAGAALGHYFGPVVLIAGDAPTQYILMALPFFVLVAARGAVRLVVAGGKHFGLQRTGRFSAADVDRAPWLLTAWTAAVLIGAGVLSYAWAQQRLYELQRLALEEQAAVDALCLEGKKVACRNMCWFVDRQVQTILLPYATVAELEVYVRDHNIDGILVWEKEPTPFFNATPYDSPAAFGRALQESPLFGPPRTSGTWRWYPVLATATAKEQP
jgi:hypothetical protein